MDTLNELCFQQIAWSFLNTIPQNEAEYYSLNEANLTDSIVQFWYR